MTTNINAAFKKFMKETVNLAPVDTSNARLDRDNLHERIHAFENKIDKFPRLAPENDLNFGSFARRTKKRPLDDVDMFICLHGDGSSYNDLGDNGIEINVNSIFSDLNYYTGDNGKLSSTKILNKFKHSVVDLYQYRNAQLSRDHEAVVLDLYGKEWSFDIVPCFITTKVDGFDFYIIPDGRGGWKKADPRVDQKRVSENNQYHNGNLLSIIRLAKFWNSRATMPSISSYLLENMVINCFSNCSPMDVYMDKNIVVFLDFIKSEIYSPVYDPKGFYGNLNDLSDEEKFKISARAHYDLSRARRARELEYISASDTHKECINQWREIFGTEFPAYG